MADQLLKNKRAEQEADRIGAQFANSNDVMGDMGKTFNFDFSGVQLHGGAEGESMAANHGDLAYAQGNNAYFGGDILNQHTPEANMAVGHELTHVMQQNDGAGVSEHVPFGESQGLGFFGKVKGFFRNMFMGKKEKQERNRIYEYLQSEGIYENDDKYETTETLLDKESGQRERGRVLEFLRSRDALGEGDEQKSTEELQAIESELLERDRILAYLKSSKTYTKGDEDKTTEQLQAKERDQIEKQPLYDELRALGKYVTPGDINGSMDRLREKIKGIKTDRAIDAGDMASEVDFSEEDKSTESRYEYKDKVKFQQEFGESWTQAYNRQQEDVKKNGNYLYRLSTAKDAETAFASQIGESMIEASIGYKIAYTLLSKTPLYQKVVATMESAGKGGHISRLLWNIRPVYIDDKGKFASKKDEESHQWNINYLKSVSINPEDTSIAEDYVDEILGMSPYVAMMIFQGEDFVESNFEMVHRMALINLNFDYYKNTKAFKGYLKSQNGGVDPGDEANWPLKAKAAGRLADVMGLLGYLYEHVQGKNGVGGESPVDIRFANREKGDFKSKYANVDEKATKKLALAKYEEYNSIIIKYHDQGGVTKNALPDDTYKRKRA